MPAKTVQISARIPVSFYFQAKKKPHQSLRDFESKEVQDVVALTNESLM